MISTRREFLQRTAVAGAALSVPYVWTTSQAQAQGRRRGNPSGPTIAAIGVGGSRGAFAQGRAIALRAANHGRMIAVCDVDDVHNAEFNSRFDGRLKTYQDYRKLLEEAKPDVVTIGTPDHWHVPIAIAALKAGCDVYCEKPLTLTIEEGIRIRDAVHETGRVFQVGTQQRSEHNLLFLKAIAIVKSGRLGKNVNVDLAIGGGETGGPFETATPPSDLDWDLWLGPANQADYSDQRRKDFRWYFDYSGGKMTDWGAHHIDIAQWALGHDRSGPLHVSGTGKFTPLVPDGFNWLAYLAGDAALPNGFHTATTFRIRLQYDDGSTITVHDNYVSDDERTKFPNGILFTGDDGRIFVNRERLSGRPVEQLSANDWSDIHQQMIRLYNGQWPGDHMRNFFECVRQRSVPIADVDTHHRTMTSCHLCNIALMLGRDLHWDPAAEEFLGDDQATTLRSRHPRDAYSLAATT